MKTMKTCAMCGKEFERKSGSHKYCSPKCARKADRKYSIENIKERTRRMHDIQHKIYYAYQNKCALCGWQISKELLCVRGRYQWSHGCDIHHIVPASKGGSDAYDNLILLCPNCHKKADLGLIPDEQLKGRTKPFEMTEQQKLEAKDRCSKLVADAIAKGLGLL